MRKSFLKMVLFFSPFLMALGLESFVLPIDFFTFRLNEALVIRKFRSLLPGRFYPNMNLTKEEEGDLGHHTRYSLRRTVQWITDSYGYRKQGSDRLKYEVVIVGQSETFGAALTQREMLSEVLEDQLNLAVYPFAPAGMDSFLKERRFLLHPPKIVIVSSMEWSIFYLPTPRIPSVKKGGLYETPRDIVRRMKQYRPIQSFSVFLDRLYKMSMVRYLKASMRRRFSDREKLVSNGVDSRFGSILFLQGAEANRDVPEQKLNQAIQTINAYNDLLKSRGIRFIFLPIPNKETIFYECLGTQRPVFLKQLVARLKQLGVETVDTQEAFEKAFQQDSVLLYYKDDTHWNANGVKIAADLIKNLIEKRS
jgi:alginate O-acetyltransferase complex protein AlgJ